MSAIKYICPEEGCGLSFHSRKLAKTHMARMGHRGGVIVDEIPITPIKKSKPKRKKSKKQKNMERAYALYLKYVEEIESERAIIKKIAKDMRIGQNKIKGWLGTIKGIQKRKGEKVKDTKTPDKVTEPEDEDSEKTPESTIWLRVLPNVAEEILNGLHFSDGIEIIENPNNGNKILKFSNLYLQDYDWASFYYNFAGIPLEISDLLFIINSGIPPQQNTKIFDMAQRKIYGVTDISDGGCAISSLENKDTIEVSVIMGRLEDVQQDNMACVVGKWKKPPFSYRQSTTTTTHTHTPAPTKQTKFEDWKEDEWYWGLTGYAAQEEELQTGLGSMSLGMRVGGHDVDRRIPPRQPQKPTELPDIKYPIYRLVSYHMEDHNLLYLITDRTYDYSYYE